MQFSPTTTSYALLGLLNLRSWSTYELAKQVKRSLHWFWPRAERKLYQEPKLLVAAGLATASMEATGNRPRTVYTITDAGRAALAAWLSEPPEPRSAEFAAMVKVFFADAGSLDQLEGTLDAIEAEAWERIDELALMSGQLVEGARFPERLQLGAVSLRLQLEQDLAVVRWVAWAREQVSAWNGTTDPGSWDPKASLTELLADVETMRARTPV